MFNREIDETTRARLKAQYPTLQVRGEGSRKISSVALASKNIKRLLKKEFPETEFSVTSDKYSGGTSVYIYWTLFPDAPTSDALDRLIGAFQSGRFDGMTDTSYSNDDPDRMDFRAMFGSAKYIVPQPCPLTPEKQADYDARQMRAKTPAVTTAIRTKPVNRF